MKLGDFLSQHAVFTVADVEHFLKSKGSVNTNTRKSLLAYYRQQGRIIPIRRGLYASVPPGSTPDNYSADPYLVAAKLSEDAVLGYHTALEYHEIAYSAYRSLHYLSVHKSVPLRFRGFLYTRVQFPYKLRLKGQESFGVISQKRAGVEVKVTGLERTFVDVLDRPDLAGSWEEIWRSLETINFFDLDQLIEYVLLLDNATTAAKVGFYLDQHRHELMVEEFHLKPLRDMRPRQPHYIARSNRKNNQWVKSWNLLIPVDILNRSWGEVL